MAITNEVLDEILKDYKSPEDFTGKNGILKQLTKRADGPAKKCFFHS